MDLERFRERMEEREVTCRAEVDGRGQHHLGYNQERPGLVVADRSFIILVSVYSSFIH